MHLLTRGLIKNFLSSYLVGCNKLKLEFYVLNYNFNAKNVEMFNIFENYIVYDEAIKLCKKRKRGTITWDEFVEEIDRAIKWQEWSRREYEISVGDAFETDLDMFEKWDCYQQAHANIEIIATYVYKTFLKEIKKSE